jgi:hypothetical protein
VYALNKQTQIGGIFCNLARAFDKILVGELFCYGIHGVYAQWFECYLVNRKQKVEIKLQNRQQKSSSNWGTIKCGVPQGPLLFVMYINYIPLGIDTYSKPVLFADLTNVLFTASSLNELQIRCATVAEWLLSVTHSAGPVQ